jgi:hypothetical protein
MDFISARGDSSSSPEWMPMTAGANCSRVDHPRGACADRRRDPPGRAVSPGRRPETRRDAALPGRPRPIARRCASTRGTQRAAQNRHLRSQSKRPQPLTARSCRTYTHTQRVPFISHFPGNRSTRSMEAGTDANERPQIRFAESHAAAVKHTVITAEKTIGRIKRYLQLTTVMAAKQRAKAHTVTRMAAKVSAGRPPSCHANTAANK